jgi:hypothetical protein
VVFVIVPSAGLEPVPRSSADEDVRSLVAHEQASVVSDSHGVVVLSWVPRPSASSVVVP